MYKDVTILNTETTGVDFKEDEVIALAVGRCSNAGNWIAGVNYFKADKKITPEIAYIHDITQDMLGDKMFHQVAPTYNDMGEYIVMYNADFHATMINRNGVELLKDKKIICAMRIARKLAAKHFDMDNYKLNYARYFLGVEVDRNDYRSNTETTNVVVGNVFDKLCQLLLELGEISAIDMAEVYEWVNQPVIYKKMTFGKHAGKLFEDIPLEYWNWALSNLDTLQEDNPKYDSDLAASIALALEKII